MKKTALYVAGLLGVLSLAVACENDDTDFSNYTLVGTSIADEDDDTAGTDTIYIRYSNGGATITDDANGYVSHSGADVTVSDTASLRGMVLVLSGSASDGSLLVYRSKKYTIVLNGLSLTNADGSAINNQCSKSLYVECADGTVNTLADGVTYATQDYDQKGTLFSEGQVFFTGTGQLTVTANGKNAIASDDFVTIEDGAVVSCNVKATGSNGIKVNDGMFVNGGRLTIDVASDGGRGIRNDARTVITGGTVSITTTGDCLIETVDGVADTTSAACIKCDSLFTMSGGTVTLKSTGDGGKGIRCNENIEVSGGTLTVTTTGDNKEGKPKALKSDTGIIISGGYLKASVEKSWACDNGTDSEDPADHLTIVGTPMFTPVIEKRIVEVEFWK